MKKSKEPPYGGSFKIFNVFANAVSLRLRRRSLKPIGFSISANRETTVSRPLPGPRVKSLTFLPLWGAAGAL